MHLCTEPSVHGTDLDRSRECQVSMEQIRVQERHRGFLQHRSLQRRQELLVRSDSTDNFLRFVLF